MYTGRAGPVLVTVALSDVRFIGLHCASVAHQRLRVPACVQVLRIE